MSFYRSGDMQTIIEKLREATAGTGYEGRLYLVGGIVRDRILQRPPCDDIDIVLEGDAAELAAFVFDISLAKQPPITYPRFGTAGINVGSAQVEIVGARRESYGHASRKPSTKPATLYDDVLRRDFTINTLLENLHTGEILDLTGKAHSDIRDRIIRTPLDPLVTFNDDPLRMLRAIRFAARLGFDIDEQTWRAICAMSHRINIVSAERIRGEFVKIIMDEDATGGLEMLRESGLLEKFAPELAAMYGVGQNVYHLCDVWKHSLKTLESIPPQQGLVMRLTALLHDVGKVQTRTEDVPGEVHFYRHEEVGAQIAEQLLKRLTFSNAQAEEVAFLISMHLRVGSYNEEWSDAAMRRLIRDAGEHLDDLITIAQADSTAAKTMTDQSALASFRSRLAQVKEKLRGKTIESPLSGAEIMDALGLEESPKIGEAKKYLEEQIVQGNLLPGDKVKGLQLLLKAEQFGLK